MNQCLEFGLEARFTHDQASLETMTCAIFMGGGGMGRGGGGGGGGREEEKSGWMGMCAHL